MIEEFAKGRTTFMITHNLGSLQVADRIVLLNAGRIEAVGTDPELRKSSPLYRKLNEIHFQRESADAALQLSFRRGIGDDSRRTPENWRGWRTSRKQFLPTFFE